MNNKDNKQESTEKPEEIIDDLAESLNEMHEKLVESTTNVGFARDVIKSIRPIIVELGNSTTSNLDAIELYESNMEYLRTIRDEVRINLGLISPQINLVNLTAGTAINLVSTSGSTYAFIAESSDFSLSSFPIILTPEQHNIYATRFTELDESLGNTYREIWEVLYGTRANPERAALFLIRQSFDHLFEKLAPDDEVRKSSFWTIKNGDKPDEVWREEKIRYAASVHINDKARAATLIASSKHMLRVYKALNRAHERGEINISKARTALEEMRTFLEEWVDAIGI